MSLLAAPKPRAKANQNDAEECVFGIGGVAAAAAGLFTLQFGPFAGIAITDEALRVSDSNGDNTLNRFEQEQLPSGLVVHFDANRGRPVVDVATSDVVVSTVEPTYSEDDGRDKEYVWDQRVRKFKERKEAVFGLLYAPSVLIVGLIASLNRLTKKVKTLRKVSPKTKRWKQKIRADKAFVVNAIKALLEQAKEQKVTDETIKGLKMFFGAYRDVDDNFDDDLATELAGNLASLEVLRRKVRDQETAINAMKLNQKTAINAMMLRGKRNVSYSYRLATELEQKKEEVKELEEDVDRLTEEFDN